MLKKVFINLFKELKKQENNDNLKHLPSKIYNILPLFPFLSSHLILYYNYLHFINDFYKDNYS